MLNLRNLDQLLKENLKDKIIFIRVDLNVPIKDEIVLDETRIERITPTINELLEKEQIYLDFLLIKFHFFLNSYRVIFIVYDNF